MGALYKGSLNSSRPALRRYLGDNSAVIGIGDYVAEGTAGEAILATAGDRLLGVVVGFETKSGGQTDFDSGSLTDVTMAADNQTVAQEKVVVDINPLSLNSIPLSAAAGTTTGSDKSGVSFELTDHDTVNEASVKTDGTAQQLYSQGVDPNNSSNVIVSIAESSLHR